MWTTRLAKWPRRVRDSRFMIRASLLQKLISKFNHFKKTFILFFEVFRWRLFGVGAYSSRPLMIILFCTFLLECRKYPNYSRRIKLPGGLKSLCLVVEDYLVKSDAFYTGVCMFAFLLTWIFIDSGKSKSPKLCPLLHTDHPHSALLHLL